MLQNMKSARVKLGISQKQLAEKTGISESTIQNAEAGRNIPRADIVKRIAHVLNVSVDYIMEDINIKD